MKIALVPLGILAIIFGPVFFHQIRLVPDFERMTGMTEDIEATAPPVLTFSQKQKLRQICDYPAHIHEGWCQRVRMFYGAEYY